MSTHDYPTRKVRGSDLDGTMVLVGESGGLCAIYGRGPAAFGGITVDTEHGTLYLQPDEDYAVYDDRQFEDVNTADGSAIDSREERDPDIEVTVTLNDGSRATWWLTDDDWTLVERTLGRQPDSHRL